jgi:pimeloyl-ACP methyl ester carboxylesterase
VTQAASRLDSYRTEQLTIGGCRLVADVRPGDGVPCVYLHGALLSRTDSRRLFDDPGFAGPVVLPDSRGHGSSVAGDYSDQTWDRLIADVVAWLDHLDLYDVFLAGASMGAVIAPAVALARPDRVSSLGLVLPVLLGRDMPAPADHQRALTALSAAFATPSLDAIVSGYASTPAVAEWVRALPQKHEDLAGVCAYFQQDRTVAGLPYTTVDLATLTIPTTIVAGADAVHPAVVGEQLAEILPNANLVPLAGVPAAQQEAVISAALLDHLRQRTTQ